VLSVIAASATEPGYWEERDSRTHKVGCTFCPCRRSLDWSTTFLQVSLDYYRRESAKVYSKYKEGVPRGQVGASELVHFPRESDV
jgi:hypothetical protein